MRFIALSFAIMAALSPPALWAAETVTIGVPNWPSVKITARVIEAIAEDEFGIDIDVVDALNDEIFDGIHRGRGKIDIHPEVWLPNHAAAVAKYVDEAGTMVLTPHAYDAIQGICIHRAVSTELGVTAIHQLTDPEIATKLDNNGDGRGDIWIGAEGWGSTDIERIKARTYGYDKTMELHVSEEADMLVRLNASVAEGLPFVFSCYGPHHIFQTHDLILIEEPAYEASRWVLAQPEDDENWLENSKIDVGWPQVRVHMAYSVRLRDAAPELVAMLDRIELNSLMVSGWTYAIEVENVDPEEFARKWVESHPLIVDTWLDR